MTTVDGAAAMQRAVLAHTHAGPLDKFVAHMRAAPKFDESKVKRDKGGRFASREERALDALREKQQQEIIDKYGEGLIEDGLLPMENITSYVENLPKDQDPEGTYNEIMSDLMRMAKEEADLRESFDSTYIGPDYKPKKTYKAPTEFDFGHASSLDNFIAAMEEAQPEDALQFGVRGMKWGVRRSKEQLARANPDADPDAIKAVETQAKITAAGTLNVVSSKDLQQLVDRIKLEQKYVDTTLAGSSTTQKGGGLIRKVLGNELKYALNKQDGPIVSGFKAAKAFREGKIKEAAAKAAEAAKERKAAQKKGTRKTTKLYKNALEEYQKKADANNAAYQKRLADWQAAQQRGPGPADRRTERAQQIYNVTSLGGPPPLRALPRGK